MDLGRIIDMAHPQTGTIPLGGRGGGAENAERGRKQKPKIHSDSPLYGSTSWHQHHTPKLKTLKQPNSFQLF